jgi:hypothetical protein
VSELQYPGVVEERLAGWIYTERRGDSFEAQTLLSRQVSQFGGGKAGQNESSFTLGACFASDVDK